MGSQESGVKGQNPLPLPAGHAALKQPRTRLAFWAASAHCWLTLSFSPTSTPKSSPQGCSPAALCPACACVWDVLTHLHPQPARFLSSMGRDAAFEEGTGEGRGTFQSCFLPKSLLSSIRELYLFCINYSLFVLADVSLALCCQGVSYHSSSGAFLILWT